MKSTTYGFSKFVSWSGMLLFATMLVFILYCGFTLFHGLTQWLWLCLPLIMVLAFIYAFARWNFIPMLQGCITLELDEEKVQSYLTGVVIYWKDVVEISEDYGQYYSAIKFQMIDERDNQAISTRWIEGSTKSICDAMQDYFAKTL